MLALIVQQAETGWSELLLLIATILFFVAWLWYIGDPVRPRGLRVTPALTIVGFLLLALALLLAAV